MRLPSAIAIVLLVSSLSGCVTSHYDPTDVASLYASLSVEDLSMRFTHPELYDGRDVGAKGNALQEIVRRGLIHRGMTSEQIVRILGWPDGSTDITVGEPFCYCYGYKHSELKVEFCPKGMVTRAVWSDTNYDPNGPDNFPTTIREY